jgi:hypothetical protein
MQQRRTDRRRVLRGAQIVLNSGSSVLDCTVRDYNERGARLRVPSRMGIPDQFTLLLTDNRERRTARVAWSREKESHADIGVLFDPPR